jgi:hypothetical protein
LEIHLIKKSYWSINYTHAVKYYLAVIEKLKLGAGKVLVEGGGSFWRRLRIGCYVNQPLLKLENPEIVQHEPLHQFYI